jgi:aspartyl/asparaginyl beta-hydroxylase (cupin superfamily)
MAMDRGKVESLGRDGVAALQRGDGQAARKIFASLVDAGLDGPNVQLLLAQACRLTGDETEEAEALDRLLAREPTNMKGLIMRGDAYRRREDLRAATSFYQAAIAEAQRTPQLPAGLAAEIERAQRLVAAAGQQYREHLERALAAKGMAGGAAGPRMQEAMAILFGEQVVQLQQPSIFYFPGLPQKSFYDPADFDWAAGLEAAAPEIKAELLAILDEGIPFRPYVESERDRPYSDFAGLNDDPNWSALYLWRDGRLVEENARRCPTAVAALEKVPMTRMGARTPSVLFSLLRARSRIPPHHGMLNTRLIGHLPLIVPPGCWLRVGNETRQWEEGKLLIFDDSMEHEASNPTEELRIVLLFDIWRPELGREEREAVAAIFEVIDAFGGVPNTA